MSRNLARESGAAGPRAETWPAGYRCLLLTEPGDPLGRHPRAVIIIPIGDAAAAQRAYEDLRQYAPAGEATELRAVNLAAYLAEQAAAAPAPPLTPGPALSPEPLLTSYSPPAPGSPRSPAPPPALGSASSADSSPPSAAPALAFEPPAPDTPPAFVPSPSVAATGQARASSKRRVALRRLAEMLRVLAVIATVLLAAWAVGDLRLCLLGLCR